MDNINRALFYLGGTLNYGEPVYNDLALPIVPRTTGVGRPTLATFSGNIREFTMAVGDVTDVNATELLHFWKEGSTIELHVHWATNGTNNATVRGVKWEIDFTWANMQAAGGTTAFAGVSTQSAETSIAANEPDKTHKYTSVYTFTPTGGKIGAYLCMSLKRIASVTNVAPASNPWILAVGCHISCDTNGSPNIGSK
jgi:hypothetical protein